MGDSVFPAGVPMVSPAWRNAVDNPVVVQFIHRWFAFIAAAALVMLALKAIRSGGGIAGRVLIGLVVLQIVLGISTLMSGVEIGIAVAHQANAALTLIAATFAAHAIGRVRA
jgi:cytochrome c oxidase assembly protein subunit 15